MTEDRSEKRPTGEAAVRVVAAVIRRGDAFLIGRRPGHKRHGGLWEFPGGKMRAGEDDLAAAGRELAEELGLEATQAGALLHQTIDPGSRFLIRFVEISIRGEPEAREHEELRWASAQELSALALAPADARFARTLLAVEDRPGGGVSGSLGGDP